MKKFLYVHILLMTVTCFITYTQQYNNSTAIVSQNGNGLMPSFHPYQGTQYSSPIFVASQYNNTLGNRNWRRAQGVPKHRSQHETKKVTIDDEIGRISEKIDKKIIQIKGEGNCCSYLVDLLCKEIAYVRVSDSMNKKGIIHALKDIDDIIQAEQLDDPNAIITQLAQRNVIFSLLVKRLVKDDKWITGWTVDRALKMQYLFPFSDSLNRFIVEKKPKKSQWMLHQTRWEALFPMSEFLQKSFDELISFTENTEYDKSAVMRIGWSIMVCQEAFQNSMDDNEELDALLDSDLLKNNLEGSPYKKELVQAVSEQKEKNNNKKWW